MAAYFSLKRSTVGMTPVLIVLECNVMILSRLGNASEGDFEDWLFYA